MFPLFSRDHFPGLLQYIFSDDLADLTDRDSAIHLYVPLCGSLITRCAVSGHDLPMKSSLTCLEIIKHFMSCYGAFYINNAALCVNRQCKHNKKKMPLASIYPVFDSHTVKFPFIVVTLASHSNLSMNQNKHLKPLLLVKVE